MIRKSTILFCLLAAWICVPVEAERKSTKIEFEKLVHDFGTIYEKNGDAACTFRFVNTGKSPLVIIRAQASCGCTVPSYPNNPIAPNDTAEIKVVYKAKGRPGEFVKNIYVYTNTKPDRTVLQIRGVVQPENRSNSDDEQPAATLR